MTLLTNKSVYIFHVGIEVGLGMQEHKMDVTALMKKIELTDPDPLTFHPKVSHNGLSSPFTIIS